MTRQSAHLIIVDANQEEQGSVSSVDDLVITMLNKGTLYNKLALVDCKARSLEVLQSELPMNCRASRACQPVFQLGPDTCAQFRLPVPVFLLQSYFDHYIWQVWSVLAYSPTAQTSMPLANVANRTPATRSPIAQTADAHVTSGSQNCK